MANGIIAPDKARQEMDARAAAAEASEMRYEERNASEKAIVGAIRALAAKYNAVQDIEGLADITIPALKELAARYNVTAEDMVATMTEIQLQVLQLEAVSGTIWADCWQGLKSRFAQWWAEINQGGQA